VATTQEDDACITDFGGLAPARRQTISNIFYKRGMGLHTGMQKNYNDSIVMKITINGLREEKLKSTVGISARKDESIREAITRLREAEVELERERSNHKNGGNHNGNNRNNNPKKGKPKSVHGIQLEEEEEDNQEGLDKIASSNKAKPRKNKTKPKGPIRCEFCGKSNHTEKDCRLKASIRNKLHAQGGNKATPNGILAQEAEEEEGNGDYIQDSGKA
jgi:hypothetical protein